MKYTNCNDIQVTNNSSYGFMIAFPMHARHYRIEHIVVEHDIDTCITFKHISKYLMCRCTARVLSMESIPFLPPGWSTTVTISAQPLGSHDLPLSVLKYINTISIVCIYCSKLCECLLRCSEYEPSIVYRTSSKTPLLLTEHKIKMIWKNGVIPWDKNHKTFSCYRESR